MSTELALKTVDFPALHPDSRQMQIIAQNTEGEPMGEQDLVKVRTPAGGATTWNVEIDGNVQSCDEIVGVLVGVGKRGTLWPSENPTEQRPVLVTHDLRIAYRVSDEIGSLDPEALERYRIGDRKYDWVSLSTSPEFGYGTARNGVGKRVKESRILAILRPGDVWPILVTVGPGSLRDMTTFLKRLPVFQHEAVIGLKLVRERAKSGEPYSRIVPRVVGTLTPEQGEVARKVYADPIREMFALPPGVE